MTAVGYSGTPLVRKLGLEPGMRVHYAGAPDGFDALVGELPGGVRVLERAADGLDLAMLFVTERRALERGLAALQPRLRTAGMIWVAWPKRASKVPTDVTEDVVRAVALPRGLVDVKVCAIDEVWSGLKLVTRGKRRQSSATQADDELPGGARLPGPNVEAAADGARRRRGPRGARGAL